MAGIFHKFANLEISILYRLARAMDIILRDCEKNLELVGQEFHREKKKTYNELIRSFQNSKRLYDKLDDDVCNVYQEAEYFDLVQEEAYELARILILFADRHGKNPGVGQKIENILRAKESSGNIPNSAQLDWLDYKFRMKK